MDHDQFWAIIEQARRTAGGDCAPPGHHRCPIADDIAAQLGRLPVAEVVAFQRLLNEHDARSDRHSLWGAAVLINAGCSDDGFDYFRSWLIGQGRAVYDAARADPDSLASHPQVRSRNPRTEWPASLDCQAMRYPAHDAYTAITGQPLPVQDLPRPPQDPGEAVDVSDHAELRRRYPKLWTCLGWDQTP